MKALITIITPEIEPHTREIKQNHEEYAQRHDYFYGCYSTLYWPDLPASFSKVWRILEALRNGCETVLWFDADVAAMDMTVDLATLLESNYWLAAYDQQNKEFIGNRPYLCFGLMAIRNGPETIRFFEKLFKWVESREVTYHPFEQFGADGLLREMNFAGVRPCNAAEIGSFSKELWNDGFPWKPGYPTVHLTTPLDWPKRRKVFIDHYQGIVKR